MKGIGMGGLRQIVRWLRGEKVTAVAPDAVGAAPPAVPIYRGASTMAIMGRHGDTKVLWDVADTTADGQAAVQEAERIFTEHRERGYLAYRVDERGDGSKVGGARITAFDPQITDLLLIPPVVGG